MTDAAVPTGVPTAYDDPGCTRAASARRAQMPTQTLRRAEVRSRLTAVCDDGMFDDFYRRTPPVSASELLTLAVLEDVADVLDRHGFPPLRSYALAELTASLYRLQPPRS